MCFFWAATSKSAREYIGFDKKGGYTVDEPVRNLFLLQWRVLQQERFYEIHRFLAERNKQLAGIVSGSDRIHYLQEYLYHRANSGEIAALPQSIKATVQRISQENDDTFIQFLEEFQQDRELQETLGESNVNAVLTLLAAYQQERMRGENDDPI